MDTKIKLNLILLSLGTDILEEIIKMQLNWLISIITWQEALSSGDKILSENYLQHADHFSEFWGCKKSTSLIMKMIIL